MKVCRICPVGKKSWVRYSPANTDVLFGESYLGLDGRQNDPMVRMVNFRSSILRSHTGWHYVLGQDSTLSLCLSPPMCINGN